MIATLFKSFFAAVVIAASAVAQSPAPAETGFDLVLPEGLPKRFQVELVLDGQVHPVTLHSHSVRSADATLRIADGSADDRPTALPPARTYRGAIVLGERLVSASLEHDGLYARVYSSAEDDWFITPLSGRRVPGAPVRHVARRASGFPIAACGVLDVAPTTTPVASPTATNVTLPLIAEIAFDCDVEYFVARGSSVPNVVAEIERTMDAVNLFYERDVQLTHRITHIIVRTAEPDPYSGNDSGDILANQFRGEWINNQGAVRRDIAHFVTWRSMGNILGLAYVGVVCDPYWSYGLSRFGGDFNTNASVLGHELGHNWSCPHCLDTCDVMCGCGAAAGFGPNDRAQIASFVASRSCLDRAMPELLAHWTFEETSGNQFADVGPLGWNATANGSPMLALTGASATATLAAGFDGVDDHAHASATPPGGGALRGLSVATWLRYQPHSGFARIVGNAASWYAGIVNGRFALTILGSRHYVSAVPIPTGQWLHLVATFSAEGSVRFYIDGVLVDTQTGSASLPLAGADWYLGSTAGVREFFRGDLDDVQVYDGVLNDQHVATLFFRAGRAIESPSIVNFGVGFPGSTGVPSLTAAGLPLLGRSLEVTIGGSGTFVIPGVLLIGVQEAAIPLAGGTLLTDPASAIAQVRFLLPGNLNRVPLAIPADPVLSGVPIYLQAVEVDGGAAFGLSFTPGLRITAGG
jgi:hypothetical protein